jgi:two-component system, chemotaxis family, protein-glutamate methylesterase/glutaminase
MPRLILVGASAGGVDALQHLAAQLPALPCPLLVVLHVGAHRSLLPQLLARHGELSAAHASDGEALRAGHLHVAPPDHHMLVVGDRIELTRGPREHHSRPAIDPLFLSAALSHGPGAVGVVLTGMLDDGTAGLQAIKACGGVAVVQDPEEAYAPSMPRSVLHNVDVDHCVALAAMPALLQSLTTAPVPPSFGPPSPRLLHELALSRTQGAGMDHLHAIGQPSPYACPECHGILFRVEGAVPERFRCHTGHAYTTRSLQQAVAGATDEALWNALRAAQEQQALLAHMAAVYRAARDDEQAQRADAAARQARDQAQALRSIVESAPAPLE